MFDLSGFWALFKLNYFCLLFQNLFVMRKLSLNCFISFFFLQLTIFIVYFFVSWFSFRNLTSLFARDVRRCVDSLCVQIMNVQSALITWKNVFDFGRIFVEKEKCSRKNSVADIYSKWAKSKIVKLRILWIQSVDSFGNPNLSIVEFFRLASIKAVFFFPIGIC